jgi:uncharacterized membrane protein HdeD (DUF308 family)
VRPVPGMRMWWIVLVRAVVALVLGVAVLLSEKTRPALGNFIAVYWLLGSISRCAGSSSTDRGPAAGWR